MGSPPIVKGEVSADRGPGLADRVVGPEIHLLVLDRSPEPLHEDVVAPGALAIHAAPSRPAPPARRPLAPRPTLNSYSNGTSPWGRSIAPDVWVAFLFLEAES